MTDRSSLTEIAVAASLATRELAHLDHDEIGILTVRAHAFLARTNDGLIPARDITEVTGGLLVKTDAGTFLCAGEGQATISSGQGGHVCIRPENVEVHPLPSTGNGLADHNETAGDVIGAEFLGDRLELIIDIRGTSLTASAPAGLAARPGDSVIVRVQSAHARYLDS